MNEAKNVREPLFHVARRGTVALKRQVWARVIAVFGGLITGSLICLVVYGKSPVEFLWRLVYGNFKSMDSVWNLLRNTAFLLAIGLALIPAFKMKFWNLGGNGQILMGGIATVCCMKYLGGILPDVVVWLFMLVSAVAAGMIWSAIPAIFKAFFKTNETLFTLMMNYIAAGIVAFAIKKIGGKGTTGSIGVIETAQLPVLFHDSFLIILSVALLTVIMTLYMKKSKHGYEIAVVGESENTAKYVGINVRKVIIRTLILSGAICGFVGFLFVGASEHTIVTEETLAKTGFTAFTAIIAVWIAHNDPIATIGASFGIIFINNGMPFVKATLGITEDTVANMIIGIMYLFVIACEFFISYQVIFNRKNKNALREM